MRQKSVRILYMITLILLAFPLCAKSQMDSLSDSDKSEIYIRIYRNFAYHYIYKKTTAQEDLIQKGYLEEANLFHNSPVLDTNEHLFMLLKRSDMDHPFDGYKLVQYKIDLLGVWFRHFRNRNHDFLRKFPFGVRASGDLKLDTNSVYSEGLIAYEPLPNKDIIYLSGYLFTHDVKDSFFRKEFTDESFKNYIQIRYFNYKPIVRVISGRRLVFMSEENRRIYEVKITKDRTTKSGYREELIELKKR